ncbi:hypothetical protein [Rhizobium sp. BK176]|uniref:hypothetical protein n=1 Tax=Rhizobium sp. BK176 TaxID=2587071 RepID=UPI00216A0399|nr:hypothetical protein [Rhizobium sp. BK176]MCS4089257.1 hypothetical protein [Rhizobium sp. BK176]
MRHLILVIAVTLSPAVALAECDFDKPVGSCRASISIDSTSGSKGSYSAEATVRSSASSCSKVEYFLDNTPQTTVIKNGSSEDESLFGTKPITKKSVQFKKCTQYASKDSAGKKSGGGEAADSGGPRYFQGRWTGSIGWGFARGPITLDIAVNGNHGNGISASSVGEPQRIDGTISGTRMTYRHINEDETTTVVLTKLSDNTLSYDASSAQGGMIHVTGKLTRQ